MLVHSVLVLAPSHYHTLVAEALALILRRLPGRCADAPLYGRIGGAAGKEGQGGAGCKGRHICSTGQLYHIH